ncbi:hypothetical protein Dimus_006595 [Dionaea muscipula]
MATIGHHPQHFGLLVITEADRAHRPITRVEGLLLRVRELGVGIDDGLVKPNDVAGGLTVVVVFVVVVVVFGDEDDAGEDDAAVGGRRVRRRWVPSVVVLVM